MNLTENIFLPLGDFLLNTTYIKHLKNIRNIEKNSLVQNNSIQEKKLCQVLNYATKHSRYYQSLNVINKSGQHPTQWLNQFPVLKKKQLRENIDSIVTRNDLSSLDSIKSSGSTGPHGVVYFDKNEISIPRAIQTLWWEWAGFQFGNTILQTGISTNNRSKIKRIKDVLLKTNYVSAFSHNENEILEELRKLQHKNRDHFFGYASSLYLYAKIASENNIENVRFKSVSSFGEMMLPHYRSLIENVFNTKVFNTYGCSEGLMVAAECEHGHYHIMNTHVIVELLDENDLEIQEGEYGRVVLTSLDNFTTPLIRYEVGDIALKSSKMSCECGRPFPILGEVLGRTTELLKTPHGHFITVQTVVRVMKHVEGIDQFKFIQTTPDSFVLEYKPSNDFKKENLNDVVLFFEREIFEKLSISFEEKTKIEPAPSGKVQLIKSLIS